MVSREKIDRIHMMLQTEQETRDRRKAEVTADFPDVEAEIRSRCLKDVIKVLEA